jgi:hypothetical protein
LKEELQYKRIEEQLQTKKIKDKIEEVQQMFEKQVCAEIPNAFRNRKKHIFELPYELDFDEKKIPIKARPIQMNARLMEICKSEIQDL